MSRLDSIGEIIARDPNVETKGSSEPVESESKDSSSGNEPALSSLNDTLQTLSKDVQEQKQLGQLVADPLVRQILDARAKGLEVEVTPKGSKPSEPTSSAPSVPDDFEILTNSQLADYILEAVPHRIEKVLDGQLKAFQSQQDQSLESLKYQVGAMVEERGENALADLRKKYDGITDDVVKDMLELSQKAGGSLTPTQLFYSVKAARNEPVGQKVPSVVIDSERPTVPPTSRPESSDIKMGRGPDGFRMGVKNAMKQRLGTL
jgi:hypothetical protein